MRGKVKLNQVKSRKLLLTVIFDFSKLECEDINFVSFRKNDFQLSHNLVIRMFLRSRAAIDFFQAHLLSYAAAIVHGHQHLWVFGS